MIAFLINVINVTAKINIVILALWNEKDPRHIRIVSYDLVSNDFSDGRLN